MPFSHDRHPSSTSSSLPDVLLAAEQRRISTVPGEQRHGGPSIPEDASAITAQLGSVVFYLEGGTPSQRSSYDNDDPFVTEAEAAAHEPSQLDTWPCDISEVMTISDAVNCLPGNIDSSASKHSRNGSNLMPLASETFKEELYIRGYLKRPTCRPSNVKPRTGFVFASYKALTRVLGQRRRQVVHPLGANQSIAKTRGDPESDTHPPEKRPTTSITCVTLQTLSMDSDGLESPGTDTITSASEVFDLHEFSYITAFTTPPSSPSTEAHKKGVDLGDSKHAV